MVTDVAETTSSCPRFCGSGGSSIGNQFVWLGSLAQVLNLVPNRLYGMKVLEECGRLKVVGDVGMVEERTVARDSGYAGIMVVEVDLCPAPRLGLGKCLRDRLRERRAEWVMRWEIAAGWGRTQGCTPKTGLELSTDTNWRRTKKLALLSVPGLQQLKLQLLLQHQGFHPPGPGRFQAVAGPG